ncbi:MAG: hypothetical protein KGZ66_03985 [Selenomonadales bacterium]|nr:hypothetical protein [Selenomonadales bacterium]
MLDIQSPGRGLASLIAAFARLTLKMEMNKMPLPVAQRVRRIGTHESVQY